MADQLTRYRLRRDTAAVWTSVNPTLALGEPGIETDTRKVKYGDGATAWNALDYSAAEPAGVSSFVQTLLDDASAAAFLATLGIASTSWTPTFEGSGGNPTVGYSVQYGRYAKIGPIVIAFFELTVSSTSGGSGSLRIGGLPHAVRGNGSNERYPVFVGISYANGFTTAAPRGGYGYSSTSYLTLTGDPSATARTDLNVTSLAVACNVIGAAVYLAAD